MDKTQALDLQHSYPPQGLLDKNNKFVLILKVKKKDNGT